MGDEKKDDGAEYLIKMLLEEALSRQRNEMMDNFAQILRRLPTGEASSSNGHVTPFKVLSLQETLLGCKSEMLGNLIFLETIFSIIGVGLDQDEYLSL